MNPCREIKTCGCTGKARLNNLSIGLVPPQTERIALLMVCSVQDGRSEIPRQVFFPIVGPGCGWVKLTRNLNAEIDEARIEAYRGTVSLPFELGKHGRATAKIVDDQGVESLNVMELR